MTGLGNEVQARTIAEQVAVAAVELYAQRNPPVPPKHEILAPLKWAGGIIAALMTLAATGMMVWLESRCWKSVPATILLQAWLFSRWGQSLTLP